MLYLQYVCLFKCQIVHCLGGVIICDRFNCYSMSAVKVQFEIGHEASIRTKKTANGFTHDWEVFVRGQEGANISHFVEKVVFNLHETFAKPKRGIYLFT